MGLKVIVVGAGIAGLTTAIALRQAGHSVQIHEKSKFATEVGAALGLSPNGAHVLTPLGFSFERARARAVTSWDIADGVSLKVFNSMDLTESAKRFGFPTFAIHRVDMHNELLRLAQEPAANQEVVQLHLSSRVVDANAEEGWIQLENGSRHYADLIVGADGIHSALRPMVVGSENVKPVPTGLSAFRFLIATKKMREDPALESLMKWKGTGACTLANPKDSVPERHIMWYDCQDGEVQNFVGVHRSRDIPIAADGKTDFRAAMLDEFQAYHPDLAHVVTIADEVSCWPLNIHAPLHTWTKGKMVLIGDAAHPMLPFGGQGANQAIEDAGALGRILDAVQSSEQIPARLRVFENVRMGRVSMIQTLSKVRVGQEMDVAEELKQYASPDVRVPSNFAERNGHAFSHNVLTACDAAMAAAATSEAMTDAIRFDTDSTAVGEEESTAQDGASALAFTNESLAATNHVLMATNEALKTTNQALHTTNRALIATNEALLSTNKMLMETNDQMMAATAVRENSAEAAAEEIWRAMTDTKLWMPSIINNSQKVVA